MELKILDTTLRDGEQTNNVSFSPEEKLVIVENLIFLMQIDRIEIGSCKVSDREFEAINKISSWALENNCLDKIEVLSFIDYNKSIDWLLKTECRNVNLLTKGSEKHCKIQLNKTIQQHQDDIEKTLEYAQKHDIKYSIYLEDWSRGVAESQDYVFKMCEFLKKFLPKSVILCDTMGVLNPWDTQKYIEIMKTEFKDLNFDFHCHNDYGLAVANSVFAVKSGINCIHGSINGLGERAGNANLIEFCTVINDHAKEVRMNILESEFSTISSIVERFSGKRVAGNSPIVGRDVFTQTAGIHADGDYKGNLYTSDLKADRFNRKIEYSLGKMSGKGNLEMNLKDIGIHLTNEQKQLVLKKIVNMADAKNTIAQNDLPFIISEVIGSQVIQDVFEVLECIITSSNNLPPVANVKIRYKNQEYNEFSSGNGGYDAFMNALCKIQQKTDLFIPKLVDFEVSIPKGGHTNALVETIIVWQDGVRTSGVLPDQIMSSVLATQKAINIFINKKQL